jgi:hypothetical protein
VNVFPGSLTGVTTRGSRIFTEDVAGLAAAAEPFDEFGALATGDFDADGNSDLAVGAPSEGVGAGAGGEGAGMVFLLPGSRSGLRGPGSRRFDQNTPGVPDDVEAFDGFGTALAVGDLDGNETDDVAIGVPSESVGDVDFAGAVCVLYSADFGAPEGIEGQLVTQDTPGLGETAELADDMGLALAAADFDVDGIADLAIGVPFESLGDVVNAGTFHVLPGTAAGATGTGSQTFTQDSPGIGSTAEARDGFGFSLAATTSGPAGIAPG